MYGNDGLQFVYIPCWYGELNDVENNPGPAVFDNTNPIEPVRIAREKYFFCGMYVPEGTNYFVQKKKKTSKQTQKQKPNRDLLI